LSALPQCANSASLLAWPWGVISFFRTRL
jgi:hypothetical protein